MTQSQQVDDKTQTEKVIEGLLVCESCGHTQDLEFE